MSMPFPSSPAVPERVIIDGVSYRVAKSSAVVDIDRDLLWHGDRWPKDSWYFASNLSANGQRLGLQVHFLIKRLPVGDVAELNVLVVNETIGVTRTFESVCPLDRITVRPDRLDMRTPELSLRGDRSGFVVSVKTKDAQIDITTTAAAAPVLFNGQGQVIFLGVKEQYDFAFPAMSTTGTVVLDQITYQVAGITWFDRQWGDTPTVMSSGHGNTPLGARAQSEQAPKKLMMNWIWSNPQLDNGVNVTVGQVCDMSRNEVYLPLTAVHPDGTHIVVPRALPVETSDYWTSPATGQRYPTRCVFRAPQIDTELVVEVPYKPQELVSKSPISTKFEGSATVTGTYQGQHVTGNCYLELAGNWMSARF